MRGHEIRGGSYILANGLAVGCLDGIHLLIVDCLTLRLVL